MVRSLTRRQMTALAAALSAHTALAQSIGGTHPDISEEPGGTTLPNGKRQRDEILKADYEQNLKDARDLTELAKTFELDLEKNDRFVLSLTLLKKLDEMEKLTRRIRTRMKR